MCITKPCAVLAFLTLTLSAGLAAAQTNAGHNAVVAYELMAGSTWQQGCFPPCQCPITAELPLTGTFLLAPAGADMWTRYFAVTEVRWAVQSSGAAIPITGSGKYSIGGDFALTHQLSLDLKVGTAPVQHFDSGMIVGGAEFPEIHITISVNGGECYDTVIKVHARPTTIVPPWPELWFSTSTGFTASNMPSAIPGFVHVSDGDLLSRRGTIVRKNSQLTARLGIMPPTPDLGLDAVTLGRGGSLWFSFDGQQPPMWSETLGVWLKHGDLLSEAGFVVRTNEQLLRNFTRMPPVADAGLDAVATAPNGEFLFSTDEGFHCESLGRWVGHGDLLSDRGYIVRTNAELLAKFEPIDMMGRPLPADYGLDAVILRSNREIWFSVEIGFPDAKRGWIGHGDLLSTHGYVVVRNRDLVAPFGPLEDLADFGLDAAMLLGPRRFCDFDMDDDVDLNDFTHFQALFNGANRPISSVAVAATPIDTAFDADLDGDRDVDLSDFAAFQNCFNGPNRPPACE